GDRPGALLQARQRRAARGRGVPQAAGRGVGADQEQDRRARRGVGGAAAGRDAVSLRQEPRRHLGMERAARRLGAGEGSRAARGQDGAGQREALSEDRGTMSARTQAHQVAVIGGDGIGPEVTAEAVKVLRAVAPSLERPVALTEFDWGAERWLRDKTTLPAGAMEDLRDHYAAILFGALGDPRVP